MKFFLRFAVMAVSAGAALAGPVSDFNQEFRALYADYRAALFATNMADAGKSAAALTSFTEGWATLTDRYADAPPPQFADDAEWGTTLDTIQAQLDMAAADVGAGTLPHAHEALEGVRDAVWALHQRNGISEFSDRMNAYHAAMEEVLAIDPATVGPELLPRLAQHAGVLTYLADQLLTLPSPEAGMDGYAALSEAFAASVESFRAATESGDPEAIRKAMAGLKGPYSKFFLNFG